MNEQNPRSVWPIILTVVITAVVVGGGVYFWQTSQKTEPITTTKTPETQSAQTPAPSITSKAEEPKVSSTIETGYSYENPKWEKLELDIRTKLGELFSGFYMPKSPSDENVIFVSTSASGKSTTGDWRDIISTNKIYAYNLKTGVLTKLYEEQENRILRTLGLDGSKLIVMYDLIDNSPGPCFSVWADWKKFGYLDIENPANGLEPYTMPDYQISKGKEEQKKCEAERNWEK